MILIPCAPLDAHGFFRFLIDAGTPPDGTGSEGMKPKLNMIKGDMPAHVEVRKAAMISIVFNVLEIIAGLAMVVLIDLFHLA